MIVSDKSLKEAKYILLEVHGGIGKNLMATAVVRNIKKTYPDKRVVVICGCPDIFLKNPDVYRVYNLGQALFVYQDYFAERHTVLLSAEPYRHFDYIKQQRHLVECWCEQFDIPCDSIYPEIYFSETEIEMAKLHLQKFDREMVLFQGEGGKDPKDNTKKELIISKSAMYRRNLPRTVMEEITDGLIDRGYMVGVVSTPNQYLPPKAERITFPIRAVLALIPHSVAVISIDSVLQHATALFRKKSLVLWGGTNPKCLGYEHNVNLTRVSCENPMCHRPNSFLWDTDTTGFIWDCPYNDVCMDYGSDTVLKEFDKLVEGKRGKRKFKETTAECAGKCSSGKSRDNKEDTKLENGSESLEPQVSGNSRTNTTP